MRHYPNLMMALAVVTQVLFSGAAIVPRRASGVEPTATEATNHLPSSDYDRFAPANRRTYVGYVKGCTTCHSNGAEGRKITLPGGRTTTLQNDRWVLYDEVETWAKEDKHAQAYAVLLNGRSRRMGEALKTEVHRDIRCLACHSAYPIHELKNELVDGRGLVAESLVADYRLNVGVNCEGCHGPAADRRDAEGNVLAAGWLKPHQTQPQHEDDARAWRFLAPAEKESKYGYWDVRSPVTRARICASCHIGDAEQGRVLTHEMYAAGHPPLPGFELSTFVAQMPWHWRALAEKPEDVREQFLRLTQDKVFANYQPDELAQTKQMLVGALVSLAEYLRLTAQLTDPAVQAFVAKPAWPELAQFDCFACHHALRHPAWRQSRLANGATPGRPELRGWTLALARLAADMAATNGDVNRRDDVRHFRNVTAALNATPFGDVVPLRTNAYDTSRWLTETATKMELRSLTAAEGKRFRQRLASLAAAEIADYDSARQYVWAFKVVDTELNDSLPGFTRLREAYADETNAIFRLRVRHDEDGLHPTVELPTNTPGETDPRPIDEFDVAKRYRLINAYEPSRTQRAFEQIDRLLKQQSAVP